jgi:hypothetical protein
VQEGDITTVTKLARQAADVITAAVADWMLVSCGVDATFQISINH